MVHACLRVDCGDKSVLFCCSGLH